MPPHHADLLVPKTARGRTYIRKPIADRFWAKVNKDGPIVRPDLGPCWIWTGCICKPTGYGLLNVDGRAQTAHHISLELAIGPLPDGTFACHACDNRPCVRPDHLFPGTAGDNSRDMSRKGRHKGPRMLGSAHPNAKLTEAAVIDIRRRVAGGESASSLGREFGVTPQAISSAVKFGWKHIGGGGDAIQ